MRQRISEFALSDAFDEKDLFLRVDFAELDFDDFAGAGLDVAPDEGGVDGKFAMAAVDEDEELNALRTAVGEERIKSGANSSAGVEHIIDEDDVAAVDVEADFALIDDGARAGGGEIVAVELDIEHAGVDGLMLDVADEFGQALGERHAATLDADEAEIFCAIIFLDDFMRETNEGALDFRAGHEALLFAELGQGSGGFRHVGIG